MEVMEVEKNVPVPTTALPEFIIVHLIYGEAKIMLSKSVYMYIDLIRNAAESGYTVFDEKTTRQWMKSLPELELRQWQFIRDVYESHDYRCSSLPTNGRHLTYIDWHELDSHGIEKKAVLHESRELFGLLLYFHYYGAPLLLHAFIVETVGRYTAPDKGFQSFYQEESDEDGWYHIGVPGVSKEDATDPLQLIAWGYNWLSKAFTEEINNNIGKHLPLLAKEIIEDYLPVTESVMAAGHNFMLVLHRGGGGGGGGGLCYIHSPKRIYDTYYAETNYTSKAPVFPSNQYEWEVGTMRFERFEIVVKGEIISVWACDETALILTTKGLYLLKEGNQVISGNLRHATPLPEGGPFRRKPRFIDNQERGVLFAACGSNHSLIYTSSGLFFMGSNTQYALGDQKKNAWDHSEQKMYKLDRFDRVKIKSVACGDAFSIVVTKEGVAFFSGGVKRTSYSKSNTPPSPFSPNFIKLDTGKSPIVSVVACSEFAVLLDERGNAHIIDTLCCASPTDRTPKPYIVKSLAWVRIVKVCAGQNSCAFITSTGDVHVAGEGTLTNPVKWLDVRHPVISVSFRSKVTYVLTYDGLYVRVEDGVLTKMEELSFAKHSLYDVLKNQSNKRFGNHLGEEEEAPLLLGDAACYFCGCSEPTLLGVHIPTKRHMCLNINECVNK